MSKQEKGSVRMYLVKMMNIPNRQNNENDV